MMHQYDCECSGGRQLRHAARKDLLPPRRRPGPRLGAALPLLDEAAAGLQLSWGQGIPAAQLHVYMF